MENRQPNASSESEYVRMTTLGETYHTDRRLRFNNVPTMTSHVNKHVTHTLHLTTITRPNHFPSNGVATDPMTVFYFVTHLNTDALYFRLNILF